MTDLSRLSHPKPDRSHATHARPRRAFFHLKDQTPMPAGRPAKYGERKQSLTIRITPTLREFLDSRSESVAITIEDAVRNTREFREWLEQQPRDD